MDYSAYDLKDEFRLWEVAVAVTLKEDGVIDKNNANLIFGSIRISQRYFVDPMA